jgi:hypothetical protein
MDENSVQQIATYARTLDPLHREPYIVAVIWDLYNRINTSVHRSDAVEIIETISDKIHSESVEFGKFEEWSEVEKSEWFMDKDNWIYYDGSIVFYWPDSYSVCRVCHAYTFGVARLICTDIFIGECCAGSRCGEYYEMLFGNDNEEKK